ncbi:MAG: hypothetical protein JWQ98_821 [Chlorobi bacterium]|nr:hypothetical protein [Chlorobiota bacterium]
MGAWRCYNRYAPMGLEGEMPNVLHESKQHKPYLKLSHYLLFIHLSLYFKALLSTLTGGVMCLLFGRLDSKFVRTPPWFLFMIYSYAAIHVGDVVFGQPGWEVFEVAVIVLMLIFKAALYLFVAWIINSGRLLFYFVKVQRVQEHEGRDWVTFQKLLSPGAQGE